MAERVAFYAPLKPPDHPIPSGDRRMARSLMMALKLRGHEVELASRLRSFDRDGNSVRQARIERLGKRIADRLIGRYRKLPRSQCPKAWVTYHAYHKSPDWLGPMVRRALNIPYLLIETSFARKQAGGPWDLGHRSAEAAIRTADLTLAMTAVDEAGLSPLIEPPHELRKLPPFLDLTPYKEAARAREYHRRDLSGRYGLDADQPWLLAVGMMRDDVKHQSYTLLADALRRLGDRRWQLLIIGDGVSRPKIEKLYESLEPGRVKFAGILDESELPACYVAADVYAWPAVREAYGMALLEAQASGLPVIAGCEGGVADVVRDGVTGILTMPRSPEALATAIAELLDHPVRRMDMAAAASAFVESEHSLDRASTVLDQALVDAVAIREVKARRQRVMP
ncbi:MAG: glycosyltransferase family 4 protein [Geminicoccaceae bacterium]